MKKGYVYILANAPHGTLYIGVTANLAARINQHKQGLVEGFTKTYHVTQLVYVEPYERIDEAIAREKQLKAWRRDWKIELVNNANPAWQDLSHMLMDAESSSA